jgi:hypothetical protein
MAMAQQSTVAGATRAESPKESMSENPARASYPASSRTGVLPWIVAGVLAVVAAALVVFIVRADADASGNTRNAGALVAPTADQQRAVQSAAIEAANLTTLSRARFESDFARALAGTTGDLRHDLVGKKAAYLSAMNAGKFDLKSSVVESAFESQTGNKVLALVTLNGTHVVDKVASPVTTPQRLELTMVKSGDKWLASEFLQVGVQ